MKVEEYVFHTMRLDVSCQWSGAEREGECVCERSTSNTICSQGGRRGLTACTQNLEKKRRKIAASVGEGEACRAGVITRVYARHPSPCRESETIHQMMSVDNPTSRGG